MFPNNLPNEILIDVFGALDRQSIEACQLSQRSWNRLITRYLAHLPRYVKHALYLGYFLSWSDRPQVGWCNECERFSKPISFIEYCDSNCFDDKRLCTTAEWYCVRHEAKRSLEALKDCAFEKLFFESIGKEITDSLEEIFKVFGNKIPAREVVILTNYFDEWNQADCFDHVIPFYDILPTIFSKFVDAPVKLHLPLSDGEIDILFNYNLQHEAMFIFELNEPPKVFHLPNSISEISLEFPETLEESDVKIIDLMQTQKLDNLERYTFSFNLPDARNGAGTFIEFPARLILKFLTFAMESTIHELNFCKSIIFYFKDLDSSSMGIPFWEECVAAIRVQDEYSHKHQKTRGFDYAEKFDRYELKRCDGALLIFECYEPTEIDHVEETEESHKRIKIFIEI